MPNGNGGSKAKKVRTVGVNFPYDENGDFTYEALSLTKEDEDRSLSRVAYRIIKEYFDGSGDDFKNTVSDRLARKASEQGEEPEPSFD